MSVTVTVYEADDTPHAVECETLSIALQRGRSNEFDDIGSGGGSIQLSNHTRQFDPFGTGDYGPVAPGRKVEVMDEGVPVFTGFIEDFEFKWGQFTGWATLAVRDGLTALSRTSYVAQTTFVDDVEIPEVRTINQLSGDRIVEMLDRVEVGYPALSRSIATGYVVLQADTMSTGTNVLSDFQNIARTEQGRLFVAGDGTLTFLDRYSVFGVTPVVSFSDTGSGLSFAGVRILNGSEHLHFSVTVQRAGGQPMTRTNDVAVAANPNLGPRHLSVQGLLFAADSYSDSLAHWLMTRYSEPRGIVKGLTVELNFLSPTDRALVVGLEVGDVVAVDWTPAGAGAPVSQVLAVEGRSYSLDAHDAQMSFHLSDASAPEFLIYDTDAYDNDLPYGF